MMLFIDFKKEYNFDDFLVSELAFSKR